MLINQAPFQLRGKRVVLLAHGQFSTFGAKTAVCYLRYHGDDVVAVVDRTNRGKTVQEVLGFGGEIPIVSDVSRALKLEPQVAIVGIAPQGGQLSAPLRSQVLDCVRAGLNVVSGLHEFLSDDESIVSIAKSLRASLWDVRRVSEITKVGTGQGCTTGAKTVFVTGSDCNVGKMTATLELFNEAKKRDMSAAWAATGQTGIMLRGRGIAVDRVVSDFISGAAEDLVNYEGEERDIVFVEGQGSLIHYGYAGVTLGLLYGVMPDCQVLVHAATRKTIGDSNVAMPPLTRVIDLHESTMKPYKTSPVVAVALNTAELDDGEARSAVARVAEETGLPTADPVREGAGALLDAVMLYLAQGGDRHVVE